MVGELREVDEGWGFLPLGRLPLVLFRGATLQGFLPLDGNRQLGAECSVQDRRLVVAVFLGLVTD
jgi:hypothetical protein